MDDIGERLRRRCLIHQSRRPPSQSLPSPGVIRLAGRGRKNPRLSTTLPHVSGSDPVRVARGNARLHDAIGCYPRRTPEDKT